MYLTGGLTPKNIDLIKEEDGPFMTAFLDKVVTYCYYLEYVSITILYCILNLGASK
jgi:hypothetical protein